MIATAWDKTIKKCVNRLAFTITKYTKRDWCLSHGICWNSSYTQAVCTSLHNLESNVYIRHTVPHLSTLYLSPSAEISILEVHYV